MFKTVLASTAAASLLLAPVAAAANTRAGHASVSLAPIAESLRTGSPVRSSEGLIEEGSELLLVLLFGGIGAAIIVAVENAEDDATPGSGN